MAESAAFERDEATASLEDLRSRHEHLQRQASSAVPVPVRPVLIMDIHHRPYAICGLQFQYNCAPRPCNERQPYVG